MIRILIAQEGIPDYRVPFFNVLSGKLAGLDCGLVTAAGRLSPYWLALGYREGLDAVSSAREMTLARFGRRGFWMKDLKSLARGMDLIIIGQANGFLNATPLLLGAGRRNGHPRVALWGHGATMQRTASGLMGRKFKQFLATRPDWWFAYTALSGQVVRDYGFPSDRITVVNNAVDTGSVRTAVARTGAAGRDAAFRELFGADRTARERVGVFCGRLVPAKRLGFLFEAATMVHDALPQFRLIVVGGGPEAGMVAAFCAAHDWCRMTGAQQNERKALYLALADIMLNPGAIGLAVLDAFAAGLPIVTTVDAAHGPEFGYVQQGSNGLILPSSPVSYAEAVTNLLRDADRLARMRNQAALDGSEYSVERMVDRFAAGVTACLAAASRS